MIDTTRGTGWRTTSVLPCPTERGLGP
jgi:hypothetical protein